MTKAFDRVEWDFLGKIMLKLGFDQRWVNLIMMCITTPTFSVKIDSQACGMFNSTRGVRQGDPLSPYLFILCAEGLTHRLKKAESEGEIKGIVACRRGPSISHLFFTDDSLLFSRATEQDSRKLMQILKEYEKASGQLLNVRKSSLFFSPNTSRDTQCKVLDIIGVEGLQSHEKYLGLAALNGRSRKQILNYLVGNVRRKISGWKENVLSQAGREVLIKSVAQAMPTYAMSCFKLPYGVLESIKSLVRKFWWGGDANKPGMISLAWEKMCSPKSEGGMGFKSLEVFNLALLAKQAWRLMTEEGSLFSKVFKARYFSTGSIMTSRLGPNLSFVWRSIWAGVEVLKRGMRWRIGNGVGTRIGEDPWLPLPKYFKPVTPLTEDWKQQPVSSLIDEHTRTWNYELVYSLFQTQEAKAITRLPLSRFGAADKRVWHWTRNGMFTVKSAYYVALEVLQDKNRCASGRGETSGTSRTPWNKLWKLDIPNKVKIFLWKACKAILPTNDFLHNRHCSGSPSCILCGGIKEDVKHALFDCRWAREIWQMWAQNHDASWLSRNGGFSDLMWSLTDDGDPTIAADIAMIQWQIWFRRNRFIHEGKRMNAYKILDKAIDLRNEYAAANKQIHSQIAQHSHLNNAAQVWQPPHQNCFKLNVDGATFSSQGKVGIGAVLRN